ncbi:MAG: aspartate aminotransferase B, partial [Alphaproteobacteria bacterium]|nr:aspartate aminotransferase B [Alphaproteobacteria bacterium]
EGEGYLRFSCANSDQAIEEALSRLSHWLGNNA